MQKIEIEKVEGWIVRDLRVPTPWADWRCPTLDEALLRVRDIAKDFHTPQRTETEAMLLEALDTIANHPRLHASVIAREAIAKADAPKG